MPFGKKYQPSEHHILPRRWFGDTDKKALMCRVCHDELEALIHQLERALLVANQQMYIDVCRKFLAR
jgi:hypothetical protein